MKLTPLSKETIDKIFEQASRQEDVLAYLYTIGLGLLPSAPFPNTKDVRLVWDCVLSIDDWPRVSQTTSEYLFDKAIAFDKRLNPNVLPGGFWMNGGFSISNTPLPDWYVDIEDIPVHWKEND